MGSEKRTPKKRRNKYDELLLALTQLSPFEIVWGKFVAKDEDGRKYILKNVRGYCDFEHQRIYLNHNMNKTESIEVLTHELLHSLLPSFFSDKYDSEQLNLKTLDEADEEVLVESATYYICSKYGIDTFESSYNYISDWTKNKSAEEQEKLFAVAKYVAREFAKLLDDELVYVRNYLYEEAVNLDWEKY